MIMGIIAGDIGHHSFPSAYRPWMGYNLFMSKEGR